MKLKLAFNKLFPVVIIIVLFTSCQKSEPEKKIVGDATVEIAALAISTKFRNQRVGVFTVQAFIERMLQQGFTRFISLTNNPKLRQLYGALGFVPCQRPEYQSRQADSPNVSMFFREVE